MVLLPYHQHVPRKSILSALGEIEGTSDNAVPPSTTTTTTTTTPSTGTPTAAPLTAATPVGKAQQQQPPLPPTSIYVQFRGLINLGSDTL